MLVTKENFAEHYLDFRPRKDKWRIITDGTYFYLLNVASYTTFLLDDEVTYIWDPPTLAVLRGTFDSAETLRLWLSLRRVEVA